MAKERLSVLMFLNMLMLDDSLLTAKPGVSSNCGLPDGELIWQFAMNDEPVHSEQLVIINEKMQHSFAGYFCVQFLAMEVSRGVVTWHVSVSCSGYVVIPTRTRCSNLLGRSNAFVPSCIK